MPSFLDQLKGLWHGVLNGVHRFNIMSKTETEVAAASEITQQCFNYSRIGYDSRTMSFSSNGLIGIGADNCECFWDVLESDFWHYS